MEEQINKMQAKKYKSEEEREKNREKMRKYRAEGKHMHKCLNCGISYASGHRSRHVLGYAHNLSLTDPKFKKFNGETYNELLGKKEAHTRLLPPHALEKDLKK